MIGDQEARALAFLAAKARPYGARRWDEPGILAVLRKLGDRKLGDVALALFRAADDRNANTPNVLLADTSPHWHERDLGWTAPAERWAGPVCDVCLKPQPACERNPHSGHDFVPRRGENRRLPADQIGAVIAELNNLAARRRATTTED